MTSPFFDLLPGATLVVFEGEGSLLKHDSLVASCSVRVDFKWSVGTRIHLRFPSGRFYFALGDEGVLELSNGTRLADLLWLDESTASLNPVITGSPEASIDSLVFHVCNFAPFQGSHDGRLTFEAGAWSIAMDQVSDAAIRLKEVQLGGGGAVTHVGTITRVDRLPFKWEDVVQTYGGFGHFLNWVASDRVPILFPVGFMAGTPLMQVWGDPRRHLARSGLRWFAKRSYHLLPTIWPNFLELWSENEWRAALTVAGELYSDAHHGPPLEVRIVMAHAALEVLAWQWLTNIQGLDPGRVDGENADWRIRRMLTAIGVPVHIRRGLGSLLAFSQGDDGPKTLAVIRNMVAHPKAGGGILDMPNATKVDAWRLILCYIELVFMKLCKWDGPYLDRTDPLPAWEGDTRLPPWVDP